MPLDHAAKVHVALAVGGDESDGDPFRARRHHLVLEFAEREGSHAVALFIAGRHLVAPVADELVDVPLRLLAASVTHRGDGGIVTSHLPCAFSLASSRGKTRRTLP